MSPAIISVEQQIKRYELGVIGTGILKRNMIALFLQCENVLRYTQIILEPVWQQPKKIVFPAAIPISNELSLLEK